MLSRFRSKIPTDRLPIHNFRRLSLVALDLAVHMLSFEPCISTPSLSKHVAQNSAYFFRLCFASFFRLSRTQNERCEAEIMSNNQPDAGKRGDVLTVGFGGRCIKRPSAEAPVVGKRETKLEKDRKKEAMPAANVGSAGRFWYEKACLAVRRPAFQSRQYLDVSQLRRRTGRPRDHRSKAPARAFHLVGVRLIEMSWMACLWGRP